MISAIPNQPVNFLPSEIIVDCPDKRLSLIVDADDVIRFQVAIDAPSGGSYGYGNEIRDWQVVFTWTGVGAWVSDVQGWLCANEPSAGGYIEPFADTLSPTIGVVYQVVVDVPSISGTATFSMGGQSFVISSPGSSAFIVVAATTDGPRITLDDSESLICVERVRVYEVFGGDGGCVVTVEVVDTADDAVLLSVDSDTRPDLFAVGSSNITASISLVGIEDIEGRCVFLRISSSCDDGGSPLCSQPIKVGECDGTILVRACLDHDAMGFDAPAIFDVRLKASLVRPRWEHDSSEERWSDGTINRYYIDRQRLMDLMIQPVDETLHPFLSALCMFDHVYLGASEYSVDADGYDPAYGDGTGTAAVSLIVRPKRELMRRVTCDAPGPGCDPANDPPCSAPNVFVNYEWSEEDQGYIITVNVYSAIGFLPDRVRMYVDDVLSDDIAWVSPAEYVFGPVVAGADVRIELTNRDVPECDWSTEFTLPNCPRAFPNQRIDVLDDCEGGTFSLYLDLIDGLGFVVAGVRVTLNGDPYAEDIFGPGEYGYGPFSYGDVVDIVIIDGSEYGCDDDRGTFESACGPCDAYPTMPTMANVDFIATADQQATIEGGVLTVGWSFLIQDLPNATPPGSTLWELNTGNTAVWNGSGWDITVNAPGTVINVLQNAASPDYDKWWVVRGAATGTALYPSGKMVLQYLYPTRSNDSDTNPGSRFFDRSFLTDERADDQNLTDCRIGKIFLSTTNLSDSYTIPFGEYGELAGCTTAGSHDLDGIWGRVVWYGGPTGTDFQGLSVARFFAP